MVGASLCASVPGARASEHPGRRRPVRPEPRGRERGACARLPRWLVEGARNQREGSLAPSPQRRPWPPGERGHSAPALNVDSPSAGAGGGQAGAVLVTHGEEAA